jgi:hypothetical protein
MHQGWDSSNVGKSHSRKRSQSNKDQSFNDGTHTPSASSDKETYAFEDSISCSLKSSSHG